MQTAEKLARKNREGLSLWLKLLAELGMTYKEIAEKVGVSPPLITYWVQRKRLYTLDDAAYIYGTFADVVMERWPKDVRKQQKLLPLMKRLVRTWQEASELQTQHAEQELDALFDQWSPLRKKAERTAEDWYQLTTASDRAKQLAAAIHEHALVAEAWKTAQATIAKAEAEAATAPPVRRQVRHSRRGKRTSAKR